MRLIDADELNTHKFLTPQVKVIGGRRNGKTREQIIEAYQKGWNDAIDAIIDNAPTVEQNWKFYYDHGYKQAERDLKRPQGEWISVSERLPEALQTVLVTSKGGYVYTSCIAHGDWEYGGEVIAWMPLPEPYKKDGVE